MRPRLHCVWFGPGQYPRLARVLEHTARQWCTGWDVDVRRVDPTTLAAASGSISHAANSYKLEWWNRAVQTSPDGARLLLLDVDTFVAGQLDPLWDHAFDFAYTVREASRFPLNGGVVAVRVNERSRAWFDRWAREDREMMMDASLHAPWRKKYGGMNQASLGRLLESGSHAVSIAALPCREWNAEDTCWGRPGFELGAARIVHVKSALRMSVFMTDVTPALRPVAQHWRDLERAALAYNNK